jgi:hypothetical protein
MRSLRWWLALSLAALLWFPDGVRAGDETAPPVAVAAVPAVAPALQAFLVTIEPGELYWQRFGHNAILLRDPSSGRSVSYNFGYFDFAQQDFLLRFVRGRMLYQAVAIDGDRDIEGYLAEHRRVWIQELRLDAAAVEILAQHLADHVRPENRDYRYDYYAINCSTKVRDALDLALGGALKKATEHRSHGWTYRRFTRAYAQDELWMYLGTDLALGQPVDEPLSIWQEAFIPGELKRQIREITLADGQPLVVNERLLPAAADSSEIWPQVPDWRAQFAATGIALAGLLLGLLRLAESGGLARLPLALTGAFLAFVTGAAGILICGLMLATDHASAARNENLLLFSPFWWLTLPAWLQLLVRHNLTPKVIVLARIGGWLAFAGIVLAALTKVLRSFDQSNIEWLLLMWPLVLALRHVLAKRCMLAVSSR